MRVAITGAAGSIGSVLLVCLVEHGHEVIGVDVHPAPDGYSGPWHTADCTDPDAVAEVFAQAGPLDAVVHLAGIPTESSLPDALHSHVVSTGVLLDAMVSTGVTRIVYASSNHAVGRTPRESVDQGDGVLLTVEAPPRPDTFYGVAKVSAEALLRLFVDRHDIDAVSCRIGSFSERPETVRALSSWLSPDDTVRMFEAALTAPAPGFAILYGISANTRAWWDLEPGRRLGYEPQDDAEEFSDEVPIRPQDPADIAYVGGPYAGEQFYRAAVAGSTPA